jgi:hypothetical protein
VRADLAAAVVGLCLLAASIGVLVVTPRSLRSVARYRLWRVRDGVFDAVLAGDVPKEKGLVLVERIERTCRNDLTLGRLLLLGVLLDREKMDTLLSEPQRRELATDLWREPTLVKHLAAFEHARARFLMVGSPLGWLLLAVLPIAKMLLRDRRSLQRRMDAAAYTVGTTGPRTPLAI